MHVIDPVAANVALVLVVIVASMICLGFILFLITLTDVLPYKVDDFLADLVIPAAAIFILSGIGAIGFSFVAIADVQDQLQAQAQKRYDIQLSDSQMNELWDVKNRDTRTGNIDGQQVKLMGSTITNDNKVITLVKQGETYLLESANLTELPTR